MDLTIPTITQLPSDTFFQFERNDATVICCARAYELPVGFTFSTKECYIFAEELTLAGDISIPGKTLEIACNTLFLKLDHITINASGANGPNAISSTDIDKCEGGAGLHGGCVRIYVEYLTSHNLTGLKLIADGGFGGNGATPIASSVPANDGGDAKPSNLKGGKAGRGGDGGTVAISYGSVMKDLIHSLISVRELTWAKAAAFLGPGEIGDMALAEPGKISASVLATYGKIITDMHLFATALQETNGLITKLQNNNDDAKAARKLSDDLLELVSGYVSKCLDMEDDVEGITDINLTALLDFNTSVSEWLGDANNLDAAEFAKKLTAMSWLDALTYKPMKGSSFRSAIGKVFEACATNVLDTNIDVRQYMCHVRPGGAGAPGDGIPRGGSNTGPTATDGDKGTIQVLGLDFDGGEADLTSSHAFALPEQCRMVLDAANQIYLNGNPDTLTQAAQIYRKLLKRLSFVPTVFQTDKTNTTLVPLTDSALKVAFESLADTKRLSMNVPGELISIRNECASRLDQLLLGHDMFGFSANYAPRLSYSYYDGRITCLRQTLQSFETLHDQYLTTMNSQDAAAKYLASNLTVIREQKSQAEATISLLTDSNGPLRNLKLQIELNTPMLAEKRKKIKEDIVAIKTDIENHISLDVQDVLDALCTLSLAPTKFTFVMQAASLGYKTYANVKDDSGAFVKRDLVISQFTDAGKSLTEMTQAYKGRADGTIEASAADGIKLMTEVETFRSLVQRFKDAIRPSHREDLEKELDEYIELVQSRNSALVDYNGAVMLWYKATHDLENFTKWEESLAQAQLKLDSNLPSIYYWIRRSRDAFRMEVLTHLNMAGRALDYWGLTTRPKLKGPLKLANAATLKGEQENLKTAFEAAENKFGGNIGSRWPNAGKQGPMYALNTGERLTLQKRQSRIIDGKKHEFHAVEVQLTPNMYCNLEGHADEILLDTRKNIRLDQLRFWIIGLTMDADPKTKSQTVNVDMSVDGDEIIEDINGTQFFFNHGRITIDRMSYENTGLLSRAECIESRYTTTALFGYNGIGDLKAGAQAAIGPWSKWRFEVPVSSNLSMAKVTAVYIEFAGHSG